MKRNLALILLLGIVLVSVPAHGFVDWLFGGSSSRGAIGNSVAGDLRAWWTGNPVYQFNPFYSGGQPQQQQRGQAAPTVQYAPGQGSYSYGPQGSAMQYQQPGSAYPAPQQGYGQYQQPRAGYPAPQGGYAQYQQPSPGAYQAQATPNYGQTYSVPLQQPAQPGYSPTLPAGQPYQGGYQGYQGAPPR
jgi:hypothetical protein